MGTTVKTEHNGAKNGGGSYGGRAEVKDTSRHLRREDAKTLVRAAKIIYEPKNPVVEYVDEFGDAQVIHRPKGRAVRQFRGMNTPALRLNRAIAMLLGDRIRERRLALGLTMKEVGIRAGLSSATPKQYIAAIENASLPGRRTEGVRLGTLYALSYALECAPSDLLPSYEEAVKLAEVSPEEFKALAV